MITCFLRSNCTAMDSLILGSDVMEYPLTVSIYRLVALHSSSDTLGEPYLSIICCMMKMHTVDVKRHKELTLHSFIGKMFVDVD